MITVYAKNVCGCCTTAMQFNSLESAKEIFKHAGLGHHSITDDAGITHESIDTFYGFSENNEEQNDKSIDYLFGYLEAMKRAD